MGLGWAALQPLPFCDLPRTVPLCGSRMDVQLDPRPGPNHVCSPSGHLHWLGRPLLCSGAHARCMMVLLLLPLVRPCWVHSVDVWHAIKHCSCDSVSVKVVDSILSSPLRRRFLTLISPAACFVQSPGAVDPSGYHIVNLSGWTVPARGYRCRENTRAPAPMFPVAMAWCIVA